MKAKNKIKIAIITNVIPTYREGFYKRIFDIKEFEISVFCHSSIKSLKINTSEEKFDNNVKLIKYIELFKGKALWQFIPYLHIYKNYEIIFVDGNLRHISQAFFSTFLVLLQRKVVILSTVHSYSNKLIQQKIRLLWWRIFKYFFMYVERDVKQMIGLGFNPKCIMSMNNGLDQSIIENEKKKWNKKNLNEWRLNKKLESKKILLGSSRITKDKYDILIEILPKLIKYYPEIIFVIIGDGIYKSNLEKKVNELNISEYVRFEGAIYDEKILAPWFLSSYLFLHPSAIGLSLMHAFGYGLPVLTHSSWQDHGPEFSIFKEGFNGFTFEKNNSDDLLTKLEYLIKYEDILNQIKLNCTENVQKKYNVEQMANNFRSFCLNILS